MIGESIGGKNRRGFLEPGSGPRPVVKSEPQDCEPVSGGVSTSLHQSPIGIWTDSPDATARPFCLPQPRRSSVPCRVQSFVTYLVAYNQPTLAHGMGSKDADNSMSPVGRITNYVRWLIANPLSVHRPSHLPTQTPSQA